MYRTVLVIIGLCFSLSIAADTSLHELRKKAVCTAAWIAGNTQGHPRWTAIQRQAERMKNLNQGHSQQYQHNNQDQAKHQQSKQLSAKQIKQAREYRQTYTKCFKQGKQQPYNQQKVHNKVKELQRLSRQLDAKQ